MDDTYDEYSATATCDPNSDQCVTLLPADCAGVNGGSAVSDACGVCSNDASYNANAEVGCMDDTFVEYSATATCDPNSDQCVTPACSDNVVTLSMYDAWSDSWNGGSWSLTDDATNTVVASGNGTDANALTTDVELCLPTGCYTFTAGGGGFPNEMAWSLTDASGTVLANACLLYTSDAADE